jgi:hypothetical protein
MINALRFKQIEIYAWVFQQTDGFREIIIFAETLKLRIGQNEWFFFYFKSNLKLNCQVKISSGTSPFSLEIVIPIWISFNIFTFSRMSWYSKSYFYPIKHQIISKIIKLYHPSISLDQFSLQGTQYPETKWDTCKIIKKIYTTAITL